jgi:hypothetical protein
VPGDWTARTIGSGPLFDLVLRRSPDAVQRRGSRHPVLLVSDREVLACVGVSEEAPAKRELHAFVDEQVRV